ncbi:MAG: NUDIX domain-containing protein [Novosphingobium sp.]
MLPTAPSDQPMPADTYTVIPAATVVIFRNGPEGGAPELLMMQRSQKMRFAGGAAVFPGGRVDPADRELARDLMPAEPEEIAAARIAGIRETLEETGLMIATRTPVGADEAAAGRRMLLETGSLAPVLTHFGWTLEPETLTLYAHWCPQWDEAFDTRFFVTDIGTGAVEVQVDATENTRLFWASAAEALAMAQRGEIAIIFPTHRNLERLARYGSYDEALADIAAHPVSRIHPDSEQREDGEWIVIPDGHGYPVLGQSRATVRRG